MRNPRVILFTVLLLALVAFMWQAVRAREPIYQGKKLSYWLQGYTQPVRNETSEQMADEAMREIGSNAIPTLLRMLKADDSGLKLRVVAWLEKQHVLKVSATPARDQNWRAMRGFQILCGDGRGAVNDLVHIYDRNISEWSRFATVNSLAAIGPPAKSAVPNILQWLATTTDESQRFHLIRALGQIHSQPDVVVPVLIQQLSARDATMRGGAAQALGNFGPDARAAIPILIKLSDDKNRTVSQSAAWALRLIAPKESVNAASPDQHFI